MTTIEVLKAARDLISVPERWTKWAAARNASGDDVAPSHPDAVCWCAIGALDMVAGGDWEKREDAKDAIYAAGTSGIADTNDKGDHASALAMFDRAIARLEAAT